MVEACPTRVADPTGDRSTQFVVNHMGRCMAKRNLINDLAKIPHSLDLRSPHLAATINCVLRPLEVLTRIASQPDKPKARNRILSGAMAMHATAGGAGRRSTTAGNAEVSDLTPASGLDESQRTENDVAPISDDMVSVSTWPLPVSFNQPINYSYSSSIFAKGFFLPFIPVFLSVFILMSSTFRVHGSKPPPLRLSPA